MLSKTQAKTAAWNWVLQNNLSDCILRARGRVGALRLVDVGYYLPDNPTEFWLVVELKVFDDSHIEVGRDRR